MDNVITKKISEPILNLLKKHYADRIDGDYFQMNFGNINNFYDRKTQKRQVSLAASNLEKICFSIGIGNFFKDNPFLFSEEYIEDAFSSNKPVDFAYKVDYKSKPKYFGFIENKILDGTLEETVKRASKQIFENYILPLKNKSKSEPLFFETMEERPRNFSVSICVFNPLVYLSKPDNFINYCDSRSSNINKRLSKYGFVMLTVFIDLDSINSVQGLQLEFDSLLKNANGISSSLVVPNLTVYQGYIQKDVHDSILNVNLTVKFDELLKMPYYNISSYSRITNTRDLQEDNDNIDKKLGHSIIETIIRNFKRNEEKGLTEHFPINISETYRSLGAKTREISFYVPQTIVVLDDEEKNIPREQIVEHRMSQKSYYFTCNMNLIDGQHSSRHITKFLEVFNTDKVLDNEYDAIVRKVFGKNYSSFYIKKFRQFLNGHHINVGIKGFSLEEVAQQAATNQNNIRKQSKINQITNKLREKILKLCEYFNHLDMTYKLKVNKSGWSNLPLIPKGFTTITPEYLTNAFGVWSEPNVSFTDNKHINFLLGKSNSTTNAQVGNSYENAINWFINFDDTIKSLSSKLEDSIQLYTQYEDANDDGETELRKKEFIKKYEEIVSFIKVKEVKEKLEEPSFEDLVEYLYAANATYKKDKFEEMISHLEDAYKEIIQTTEIFEERLKNAMLIHISANNYYLANNKGKNTPLLNTMQTDNLYYTINYLNILLRMNMIKKHPNDNNLLDKVTEQDIKSAIEELDSRLKSGTQLAIAENKDIKEYNFGSKGEIEQNLFNILFN